MRHAVLPHPRGSPRRTISVLFLSPLHRAFVPVMPAHRTVESHGRRVRLALTVLLPVVLLCARHSVALAQAPEERVRVHVLGVHVVDDFVVRWDRDSLVLRRSATIARRDMTGLDVWRPRSFGRTAFVYANFALAVLQTVDVESDKSRANYGVPRNVRMHLATSVGAGLTVALFQRVTHRGRWVPVLDLSPR